MDIARHDELFVISDLHMGGAAGFQILRETRRLAGFIRWVAEQRPAERVALVLDGDVVDTLAEDVVGYVAVDRAVETVTRIIDDAAFAPVWAALADFVSRDHRTLVLIIGNHDVELAFPAVQRLLVSRLAGESLAARARIEFSTMGAGYTCLVGNARVFCTHGNEVDPWNYVRYEDLARAARRINAGRTLDPADWEPNAGTKMVKDVMNEVKRRYAWIDLLKPEVQAAVGVLMVLAPGQSGKIARLLPIVGEYARARGQVDGRLSSEGFTAPKAEAARAVSADQLLGPNLMRGIRGDSARAADSADALLLAAEQSYQAPRAGGRAAEETLGAPRLIWDRLTGWVTGVGEDEALRRALLDWLAGDHTFDLDNRDQTFTDVTASVGSGIDIVVTGHTHLERAIDMGSGRYYFNCGTWIRLMRFSPAMLKDTVSFKPVYDVLSDGRMSAIDAGLPSGESLVMNQTSAVRVADGDGRVSAELLHVDGTDAVTCAPVRQFRR